MKFSEIKDMKTLVDYVNEQLGTSWCNKFGQQRKELANMQKTPTKGKLFKYDETKGNDWAINEGGHKEVQYHIHYRNGQIGYGLGFSTQYASFYNELSQIEYIKPFTDAYLTIKSSSELVKKLKLKGFTFISETEEGLQNLQEGKYYCFGKIINPTEENLQQMLEDIKGDMFELYCEIFETKNSRLLEKEMDISDVREMGKILSEKKNIILQGAPGTGKTYTTAALALSILGVNVDFRNHAAVMEEYNKRLIAFDDDGSVKNNGQIGFVTFHQSMDYEDFVEGIKPNVDEETKNVFYNIHSGIFKSLCNEASKLDDSTSFNEAFKKLMEKIPDFDEKPFELKTKTGKIFGLTRNGRENLNLHIGEGLKQQGVLTKKNVQKYLLDDSSIEYWTSFFEGVATKLKEYGYTPEKKPNNTKYVLIIDEINRGNVSKIFGELITLLEADKRKLVGVDDSPENQEKQHTIELTLPYSKEKFSVPSNLYIIGTMNTTDRSVGSIDYAVRRRFAFVTLEADSSKIENEDAKKLFDSVKRFLNETKYDMDIEDLMVGHSYFMVDNEQSLQMKWQYEILPLLMEYHKDGIISKSPLKDTEGKEIVNCKKDYQTFINAWLVENKN